MFPARMLQRKEMHAGTFGRRKKRKIAKCLVGAAGLGGDIAFRRRRPPGAGKAGDGPEEDRAARVPGKKRWNRRHGNAEWEKAARERLREHVQKYADASGLTFEEALEKLREAHRGREGFKEAHRKYQGEERISEKERR